MNTNDIDHVVQWSDDLLSFVISSPDIEAQYIDNPDIEPGSIWDKLLKAISVQVKKDGIRKDAILPGQSVASVTVNAFENIYYDVSEFFYWYFDSDDARNEFMTTQKKAGILSPLRAAVKPVVKFNLADMRDAELIPYGLDSDKLVDIATDNLTRYILNWQDWYYLRKEDEELEDHLDNKAMYREIYIDSDYGDLTNLGDYLNAAIDDPNDYGNVPYHEQEEKA